MPMAFISVVGDEDHTIQTNSPCAHTNCWFGWKNTEVAFLSFSMYFPKLSLTHNAIAREISLPFSILG